jgi:hypothetical protein
MSSTGLIVLEPACTALAFAATAWLVATCWAISVERSTLGAAAGFTRDETAAGGGPAVLDVLASATGAVSETLATLRAGACRCRLAAADPDVDIPRAELMHLA